VLRYYDKALAVDPNLIPALKGRASQYFNLKQWPQAIGDYNKVIAAEPQDWVDYHDRGVAKMEIGSVYDAISVLYHFNQYYGPRTLKDERL
jgi:tetratricopeptide (TPR) repeat protein